MLLFNYFDGATGPVQPVGWTNYTEGYVRAETRAQAERGQAERKVADEEAWGQLNLRAANWQRICDEMRKAVEGKL